jgi:C-terminal processing protease CtpA/Prc
MIRCKLRNLLWPLVGAALLSESAAAQGSLKGNRDLARGIAEGINKVLEKKFYDPQLKGVDWKKALDDAEAKISAANNVGEMYGAVDEMVVKLDDSHTRFLPPWQTQRPKFDFQMKPYGATVRIYQIKDKGPAARGGLKLGDTVIGIDGIPADRKRYLHTLTYYRFIQPAGAMVLDLVRDGKQERITLQADIHTRFGLEMVYDVSHFFDAVREAESFEEEHKFEYAQRDGIGYVRVPNFEVDTAEKTLWKVKDSRALIVDLRGNLGGSISVLERFVGYFHKDEAEIVKSVLRDKTEKMIAKPRQPSFWDIPIVVLVDSESASASEIFARHMQLSSRGIVIGDKTMGAVSISENFIQKIGADPAVFYGVQATIGHAIFPDGQDIEKVGVTPDKMCIPSAYALAQKKDPCLDMAMQTLQEKLSQPAAAAQK